MSIEISPLRVEDAPHCAELERLLFADDDPWEARTFVAALAAGHRYLAARAGGALVGYAGLGLAGPEAEVHTFAVDPAYQGRGIGRELLRALLALAGNVTVFLEVRTDNEPALALYRSEGFRVVGTRRGYYRLSGADAFTMRREVRQGEVSRREAVHGPSTSPARGGAS
ncbi:MAG: ribosomal protein S18-alanine N-acetyltransferase [Actinomycetota bacterium]|nr:ribosomal protein S18-alanine N-acetyltransferase [Actinomycetota bacterium]